MTDRFSLGEISTAKRWRIAGGKLAATEGTWVIRCDRAGTYQLPSIQTHAPPIANLTERLLISSKNTLGL
ncbi:hypothetical protein [Synechococcus sp. PCC 7336]|uniref:hypothetical protein n=1 Tax=Synechococcus sp. PCC 7336 TaxID=195250 RepID=UPI0012EA577C|nr:hypothetical protein [Synechococcus sp. PCC 7336]